MMKISLLTYWSGSHLLSFVDEREIMKSRNAIRILFLTVCFLYGSHLLAQTIVANAGGSLSGKGIYMDFSIGEPVIHTLSGSGIILTQGFHQPILLFPDKQNPSLQDFDMKVYPNPTYDHLIIEHIKGIPDQQVRIEFIDMHGRVLRSNMIGDPRFVLDVREFASATYLLHIIYKDRKFVFKIIKQ